MPTPIVIVENLVKEFDSFRAVDTVNFTVERGQIFGFLGANGAGKTTTIRILCGLLTATSGRAMVAGVDVVNNPEAVKTKIGYMSQRFSLYEDLLVKENLEFYGGVYRLKKAILKQRIDEISKRLDITPFFNSIVHDLPIGWKQRLALASAILHQPEVLFLDEPTSGVDPLTRRGFWKLIYDLAAQGTSVIVTTHYMDEAEVCERIAIMHLGKIVALGTVAELKSADHAETLEQVFMSRVQSVA
jgi:ABC-2 type transport system ATP-binding protein